MSWSRRHILGALAPLALLPGCGFVPVYGPGGDASAFRDAVRVSAPNTREGFALQGAIEDRLGPAQAPRFDLTVTLDLTESGVAVTQDQNITRFQITGSASFTLSEGGQVLTQGEVETFTSYSTTSTPVATLTAEQDAKERLAVALADLIVARILMARP